MPNAEIAGSVSAELHVVTPSELGRRWPVKDAVMRAEAGEISTVPWIQTSAVSVCRTQRYSSVSAGTLPAPVEIGGM